MLGVRKIESMERRVDFDELLALAYVLKVCPVDLMVSNEATDEPYALTPKHEFESDSVRDWIRGENVILVPTQTPEEIFADPALVMLDALRWMPRERRGNVLRHVLHMEEEDQ